MTYNVENLFDTRHDKGKNDYAYLPRSQKDTKSHKKACNKIDVDHYRQQCLNKNWSKDVLQNKMKRLADAILQVNNGRGPDLLFLSEVENKSVLKTLNQEYLSAANYQTVVLLEGPDKRGIDPAFLSRLPLAKEPKLHLIPYVAKNTRDAKWMAASRGILEATFNLPDGQKLTAFAVHFPSPSNPSYWRAQAINHLIRLKKEVPEDHLIVAGGDFNISEDDERRNSFYDKQLSQHFGISHLLGCDNCRGTNYYHTKRSWSFLDTILLGQTLTDQKGWHVDTDSIHIPNESRYQTNRYLSPAGFEPGKAVGVSDHWPLVTVIQKKK